MPVRKVGNGPAKVSNTYKPLKSVPSETDHKSIRPVEAYPYQVEPWPPVETLAPEPSFTNSSPPQNFSFPPQGSVPLPASSAFTRIATESPFVPSSITQLPIPDSFPRPPSQKWLKSPRSVPTLLNVRPDTGPGTTLIPSKSNPFLNRQTLEPPPQFNSNPTVATRASASTMDFSGMRAQQHTPRPTSMYDIRPTQPPPKIEKRGFFGRLFGFGKSQSKDPKEHRSAARLARPPTSARPMSAVLVNPPYGTTPGSTRPPSIISMDSTMTASTNKRQRAVLVKKQPNSHKHGRQASAFARPSGSPLQQNLGHVRYNSYPQTAFQQSTTNLGNLPPDFTTSAKTMHNPIPSNGPNSNNHYHTNDIANHTPAIGQAYGNPNRSSGINHFRPVAATDRTRRDQFASYLSGYDSGAQGSGYKHPVTTPSRGVCLFCNANPQYTYPNTGKMSPYCSDACQIAAATETAPHPRQLATCSYPGCVSPATMYPVDHHWNYCSEAHERLSRKGCLACRQAGEKSTQLCKGCGEIFKQRAPIIIPVPMDHDTFWRVADLFTESWVHPTPRPVPLAVYMIVSTQHSLDSYHGYRDTLEYYGEFSAKGKVVGNERILWHGTRRGCNLGEAGQTTPCTIPRCLLCFMIRGPPANDKSAGKTKVGAFGRGLYTSNKSSKANDYTGNDPNMGVVSPWKAMLLASVAAGREYHVMHCDGTTLAPPPEGFDSVCGEVRGHLNYDELVVHSNNAIRPTWLVMYK